MRLLKQLLYGQLYAGKHLQHKHWKRCKDCLKSTFVNIKINPQNWEKLILKRTEWRIHVVDCCTSFEKERIEHANPKCQLPKGNICNVGENVI